MNEEYYKILEIEPTCNFNEIKTAYRKLSIKYHPDKNNGQSDKFLSITNAYNFLSENYKNIQSNQSIIRNTSNTKNKTMYNDNFQKNSRINLENNIENNMENCIDNNELIIKHNNYNSKKYYEKQTKNIEDIDYVLNITYKQSFFGSNMPINIIRKNYINYIYSNTEKETIYIKLDKGVDENEIIILKNKGNHYDDIFSDVKITIKLIEEPCFSRNGLDIIYKKTITLKEALTGFTFNINHINNKIYKISSNNEIYLNNSEKIFLNKGFERDDFKGNLIIKFIVETPKSYPIEIINKLKELL